MREAGEIVRRDFAGPESIGVLRLREHILYNPAMDLDTLLSVLREIFALKHESACTVVRNNGIYPRHARIS